ncbi:hypothetical protein CCHL11_03737 [Colletotrichum chlorophyti]|uniref:Uncharacterized protein n=1 Tax=Colletotrichum chlorophyti TaxID=708187 RepID=A0A1Q8RQN0_9PEZI|nr:hypothetical protein CCHL11_03737 [Colletotrichum chlorophyti]
MQFARSLVVAALALGASAAPAAPGASPQVGTTPPTPAQDRCSGVICPDNSFCKVFDFGLEKPVACQANGTVSVEAETCGSVICPAGTSCCNPTCGVCAAEGQACLQWVC